MEARISRVTRLLQSGEAFDVISAERQEAPVGEISPQDYILRARSGVYHPVDFESPAQKKLRPVRGSHAPGTFWLL